MDRQLLERMVGAGVLVLALVIITPALLDGNRTETTVSRTMALPENDQPLRTHTIRPDTPAERPPVAQDVATAANSPLISDPDSGQPPDESKKTTSVASVEKPIEIKKQAPKPKPKPKPKPVATTSPEKPAAKSQPVQSGSEWAVQLGSFANQKNAQGLVDKIKGKGFSAYLLPLARNGQKTLYRVRVGPRDERSKANELALALKEAGHSGQVVSQ